MTTKTGQAAAKQGRYHHGDLRSALLAAAEAELAEAGIEKLSLRAVAKRAGVSHAAPAHHFGDARGLLTALAAQGYRIFDAALRDAGDAAGAPEGRLEEAGLAYMRFAMERPALFRLMFSSARPDYADPELAKAAEAAFVTLAGDTRSVAGADPFANEDAMQTLMIAWGIVHGLADLMNAGLMRPLLSRPQGEREATIRRLLRRTLGNG